MIAVAATKPPNAQDPVSPINTLAGYTLYTKKPNKLPATAHVIGEISAFITTATTVKKVATNNVTPDARPSRPSVKFTPFTVPNITKNINGTNK